VLCFEPTSSNGHRANRHGPGDQVSAVGVHEPTVSAVRVRCGAVLLRYRSFLCCDAEVFGEATQKFGIHGAVAEQHLLRHDGTEPAVVTAH